jgi:hypothetical protein
MISMNQTKEKPPPILEMVDGSIFDWLCISMFRDMLEGMDSGAEVDL